MSARHAGAGQGGKDRTAVNLLHPRYFVDARSVWASAVSESPEIEGERVQGTVISVQRPRAAGHLNLQLSRTFRTLSRIVAFS
jgi:hypothetical protein